MNITVLPERTETRIAIDDLEVCLIGVNPQALGKALRLESSDTDLANVLFAIGLETIARLTGLIENK